MFRTGQEVICINAKDAEPLQEKKMYMILDIIYCKCGKQNLLINIDLLNGVIPHFVSKEIGLRRCNCNEYCYWNQFLSSRFRPIQYKTISNKEIIKQPIKEKLDIEEKIHILY